MALVPISGPTAEPVSLAEAKAHLRVSGTSEDLLIASLITAARVHLELALSCAFITQTWSWFLDAWPQRMRLELPLGPAQSVSAVRVLTAGDIITTLPPASYLLSGRTVPPRLTLKERAYWSKARRLRPTAPTVSRSNSLRASATLPPIFPHRSAWRFSCSSPIGSSSGRRSRSAATARNCRR